MINKNKIEEWLKQFRDLISTAIKIAIPICLFIFVLSLTVNLIIYGFTKSNFLNILDKYLVIILNSWPASILIISIILLYKQHEAIDYFIRKRMTGVGIDGVKGSVLEEVASDIDVKAKNINDVEEDSELVGTKQIVIEEGVTKSGPNTIKSEVYQRYEEVSKIEDLMQKKLVENFKDVYQPHVKLTVSSGQKIILDGLMTTYKGLRIGVEIKYLYSKDNYTSLKFSLRKLREKLTFFDIKKLIVIIIAKDLTEEEAKSIRDYLTLKVRPYFFSLLENDSIVEVAVPPKNKRLFTW